MTDTVYMARALQLAAEGLYTTQPNPRVGCVIVKNGQIVGEGFHARAGQPHAEVQALASEFLLPDEVAHLQRHTGQGVRVVGAWARNAGRHHVAVANRLDLFQPIFVHE